MKLSSTTALLTATLLLGGCTFGSSGDTGGDSSSASSVSSIRETQNVAYEGLLEPAGISIYQEGTHRLTLDNGTFVLLESSSWDLNGYVDEEVRVYGSLRPTVESDGKIMRVDRIELLNASSSSSSSSSQSSEVSSSSTLSSSSRSSTVSSRVSSVAVVQSSQAQTSSAIDSNALQARAKAMAAVDLAPANWTQTYCTGHIGFCIPVHKNWWFTSFGTTTTYLWHLEINSEEIKGLGDGPISVNLLEGSAPVADGTVRTEGSIVVGYRSWTDNRYFVIKGESNLEAAVRYITQNLVSYEEDED